MYQIKELLPDLMPHLTGCQPEVIFWALRAAGREFCRETGAYLAVHRERLRPGMRGIDIAVPEDAEVYRINRVFVNHRRINPGLYRLDPLNHSRLLIAPEVAGKREHHHDHEEKPAEEPRNKPEIIKIEYSMIPTAKCNAYEEEFFNRYGEAIRSNALSMLFAMPRKPWTSPDMAQYHKSAYLRLKAEAIEDMESDGKELDQRSRVLIARTF